MGLVVGLRLWDVPGDNRSGPLPYGWPAKLCSLRILSWVSRQSGGGQYTQSPCPGNRLRPVVDTELAVDIVGMGLDRVQREEEPGSDLWIGQPFGDELQHFEFAFAQWLNQVRSGGLSF